VSGLVTERQALLYARAMSDGCLPQWADGILGEAWHCTCMDNRHGCDQQCSAITEESLDRAAGSVVQ
jgi:hypothetical protein